MERFHHNGRLHTDALEDRYGKIRIKLLHQDDERRESLLVDAQHFARTYALTFRNRQAIYNEEVAAIDKKIRQGGSLGKTFRQQGYAVTKNVLAVCLAAIPGWLKCAFDTDEATAKMRLSEFFVQKETGGEWLLYGTVAELYSPDFRKAEISKNDLAQINPSFDTMLRLGIADKDAVQLIQNPYQTQWDTSLTLQSKKVRQLIEKVDAILFEENAYAAIHLPI